MRLGTCLLYEGHTLQGARTKLAYFCSALVAGVYAAVDNLKRSRFFVFGRYAIAVPASSAIPLTMPSRNMHIGRLIK